MLPIALSLIVKAATVVRAVQAISSALRPAPKAPVIESVPGSEKVLCGRFAPTRDKYRYCGNSPINWFDPTGTIKDTITTSLGVGVEKDGTVVLGIKSALTGLGPIALANYEISVLGQDLSGKTLGAVATFDFEGDKRSSTITETLNTSKQLLDAFTIPQSQLVKNGSAIYRILSIVLKVSASSPRGVFQPVAGAEYVQLKFLLNANGTFANKKVGDNGSAEVIPFYSYGKDTRSELCH